MKSFFKIIIAVATLTTVQTAFAGDIKWSGQYRFEGLKVFNPSLDDGGTNKAYILHHLTLKPEITAYDGLTIHSRFDILNSTMYPNDQLGQTFGASNAGNNTTPNTNAGNADTTGDQQAAEMLAVNELYANWSHEFGVLTVGRAPMHFGLGMMFNAGHGPFDHWLENRDLVAYKIVMGNFYFMPVLGKSYEGILDQEDDINDYILQVQYENPETELALGFIWQARRSTSNANSNDTPTAVFGGAQTDNYEVNFYNFFVSQWVDQVKVAFEVGFAEGNTGLSAGTTEIAHKGFGGVLELDWKPKSSSWGMDLDLGYASGDDPATTDTFEGYVFDQNYDVAFLLFNHPMGQADFFRTAYLRNTAASPATAATLPAAAADFDTEAISNTLFASFAVNYNWSEKYELGTRLTYAQLNKDPLQTSVDSNAGIELDLSLKYEPFEGFQWINRTGIFMPGDGFKGGTNNFSAETAYGFETKAAISF